MSTISTILSALRSAVWAIDVRDDIADAIEQCYSDVNNPTLITEGIDDIIQNYVDDGTISGAVIEDLGLLTESTSNLFDCFDLESGLISTAGVLAENSSYLTTDYIAVTAGTTYYFANIYRRVYFDSTQAFVSYANSPSSFTPAEDGYIRVSCTNANRQTAKINVGSSQAYRPGRSPVDYNLRDDVYRKSEIDTMISEVDVSLTEEQIAALIALLE